LFTDSAGLPADDPQATLLTQVQGVIAEYEKAKTTRCHPRAGSPPGVIPPCLGCCATRPTSAGSISTALPILPPPLTEADTGYWCEISMRQVEVSRTIVFAQPRHARGFFEALAADNLDIGRPEQVELIFADRRVRPGRKPATLEIVKTRPPARAVPDQFLRQVSVRPLRRSRFQ
jgi:hypothetical protein